MQVEAQQLIKTGLSVLEAEASAIHHLSARLNENFANACQILLHCKGRIIVTGMGKSGHVGRKIAATLASTGSPAFFVHPGEASHGDLGMITPQDVVIAISYTGETKELLTILPLIKYLEIPLISMTGKTQSSLAKASDIPLDVSVAKEACPLGLAPTSSTTATLAMGDALALAVLEARGFTKEDFARSHPGGSLGKKLLLRVDDLMHTSTAIPKVFEHTLLSDALIEVTEKRLGMTTVVTQKDPYQLVGIFTDGDLRRTLDKGLDIHKTPIKEVMTQNFTTVLTGTLATAALALLEKKKITALPVINAKKQLVGAFNIHDLFKAGVR